MCEMKYGFEVVLGEKLVITMRAPGAGVRADAFIALKSRAEAEKLAESIKTLAATVFDGRAKPCHTP